MNMPKAGDNIIVRCNNGMMDTKYLNTVQTVVGTNDHFYAYAPGSAEVRIDPCSVVLFKTDDGTLYTTEWEVVPKVGDRVIALTVPGASYYDGKECTVTEVNPTGTGAIIRGEFPSMQKPDDTMLLGFSQWRPASSPEVKPSEEVGIITDLQAQVDRLTEQNRVLLTTVANWEQDWTTMTDALQHEAENRGWCSEYDEFVNEIASELRVGVMPRREREYAVTWTSYVTVSVDMSRTYTAASPEEAEQMAKDDYCATPETQDILDAVRNGEWEESDDSYREYEAEEV